MLSWIVEYSLERVFDSPEYEKIISGLKPCLPSLLELLKCCSAVAHVYDLFSFGICAARVLLAASHRMISRGDADLFALAAHTIHTLYLSVSFSLYLISIIF